MKKRQISSFLVVIFILGVILSVFILYKESSLVYQTGNFTKKIVLEPDRTDAGYITLKRSIDTPSALDWAKFRENGQNYLFFSILEGEVKEKVVEFSLPQNLEKGEYSVDYEVRYISGIIDKGTLTFRTP